MHGNNVRFLSLPSADRFIILCFDDGRNGIYISAQHAPRECKGCIKIFSGCGVESIIDRVVKISGHYLAAGDAGQGVWPCQAAEVDGLKISLGCGVKRLEAAYRVAVCHADSRESATTEGIAGKGCKSRGILLEILSKLAQPCGCRQHFRGD